MQDRAPFGALFLAVIRCSAPSLIAEAGSNALYRRVLELHAEIELGGIPCIRRIFVRDVNNPTLSRQQFDLFWSMLASSRLDSRRIVNLIGLVSSYDYSF